MREHLLQYIETNYDAVLNEVSDILSERKLKFTEYITMMRTKATCGYEITLKILTLMFKFKVLVIRSDFIWVSKMLSWPIVKLYLIIIIIIYSFQWCVTTYHVSQSTTMIYNIRMELANHSPNGLSVITVVCHTVQLN